MLPLGDLPMLTSLRMSDALEADMSRFVRLESLTSLKVITQSAFIKSRHAWEASSQVSAKYH